jgi:hypothetical protein
MNHYYFKFGEANCFIKQCIQDNGGVLPPQSQVPLSIYFGNWAVEDYRAGCTVNEGKDRDQIDAFFHVADHRNESVLWLFDDLVYSLIPQSDVYNGGGMTNADYTHPKAINSTVVQTFKKSQLPQAFASINSFQKYNRKTIVKLQNEEAEIAEWLFSQPHRNAKMSIRRERRLFFLSPLQFETLIFLIFHHHEIFCSTYRGGTLKDVDLNIRARNVTTIRDMQVLGDAAVQVKKSNVLIGQPNLQLSNDIYLVHLGYSFPKRNIFGKDWVENCVAQLPAVENWLNQSLDFFEIT